MQDVCRVSLIEILDLCCESYTLKKNYREIIRDTPTLLKLFYNDFLKEEFKQTQMEMIVGDYTSTDVRESRKLLSEEIPINEPVLFQARDYQLDSEIKETLSNVVNMFQTKDNNNNHSLDVAEKLSNIETKIEQMNNIQNKSLNFDPYMIQIDERLDSRIKDIVQNVINCSALRSVENNDINYKLNDVLNAVAKTQIEISSVNNNINNVNNNLNNSVNTLASNTNIAINELRSEINTKHTAEEEARKKAQVEAASQKLGEIGELDVVNLLRSIRPKLDIDRVSVATGHMADIHMKDRNKGILYMIESKNKKVLNWDDVEKFRKDFNEVTEQFKHEFKYIYGIFISINKECSTIPSIGNNIYVKDNQIFIPPDYFSDKVLSLMFWFIENYHSQKPQGVYSSDSSNITTVVQKYEFTPEIIDCIVKLRTLDDEFKDDIESLNKIIEHNTEANKYLTLHLHTQKHNHQTILHILATILPDQYSEINEKIHQEAIQRLKEFIRNTPRKNTTKAYILSEFHELPELKGMKIDEIYLTYRT